MNNEAKIKEMIKSILKMKLHINLINMEDECYYKTLAPYIIDVEDFCKRSIGLDSQQQVEMEKRILQIEIDRLENQIQLMIRNGELENKEYIDMYAEVSNEIRSKLEI